MFWQSVVRACTAALASWGLCLVPTSARADYNGLSVELHTTVTIDGTARSVWRVYANFTNEADRLDALYGSSSLGALTLQSLDVNGTGPGSSFYNLPLGGDTAPGLKQISFNPNVMWDTFVTIGVSIKEQAPYGDQTLLSPGFPPLIGANYTTTAAGWFITPTFDHDGNPETKPILNPQAEAGFLNDGDLLPRVLLAQLTVNAGDHVAGTANIVVFESDGQGGGASSILAQQTFTSVPAPAALALLALAGVRARRRR